MGSYICPPWAIKAGEALRAMEWLRDMGWEQFRVSVEEPGRWGNPARSPYDAIFAAFEARLKREAGAKEMDDGKRRYPGSTPSRAG